MAPGRRWPVAGADPILREQAVGPVPAQPNCEGLRSAADGHTLCAPTGPRQGIHANLSQASPRRCFLYYHGGVRRIDINQE